MMRKMVELLWLKAGGRSPQLCYVSILQSPYPYPYGSLRGTSTEPHVTHQEFDIQRQFIQVVNNKIVSVSPNIALCLHYIK